VQSILEEVSTRRSVMREGPPEPARRRPTRSNARSMRCLRTNGDRRRTASRIRPRLHLTFGGSDLSRIHRHFPRRCARLPSTDPAEAAAARRNPCATRRREPGSQPRFHRHLLPSSN
jgi:hypothetical protein